MKTIVVIALIVAAFSTNASAQTVYGKANDKTITTAIDTTTLHNLSTNVVYEMYITNYSASDTLYYRFDTQRGAAQDTTWSYLFPYQAVHFNNVIAKKVFRKTLRNSVFSQLRAN